MIDVAVSTIRGARHDARYLALIDVLTSKDQVDHKERLEYWQQWEFTTYPEPANVWVARIGGLYAGYLAIQNVKSYDIKIQERFDVQTVTGLLLKRAGIEVLPVVEQEGLAVA